MYEITMKGLFYKKCDSLSAAKIFFNFEKSDTEKIKVQKITKTWNHRIAFLKKLLSFGFKLEHLVKLKNVQMSNFHLKNRN